MSQLAIFDIDGTLTATNAVDDECYLRAVAATFGLAGADLDWADAPHVTDCGLARWLCTRHLGRAPQPDELAELERRFVGILRSELARTPDRFAPIDGARGIFDYLRSAGWSIALATGAWGSSARTKLDAAGLAAGEMPMACADDAESREDIVRVARERAEARAGSHFERIVSVGDAPWDVRTARSLELPFVGIGVGPNEHRLRTAGARVVLPDLADRPGVLAALEAAQIP
ncbi:MAG TPA: HAD family hydrolase [Gemmatimonadaceae bacterium]|nr:HAD family hydrolase [Gemmatimonadaceae bacterium]